MTGYNKLVQVCSG